MVEWFHFILLNLIIKFLLVFLCGWVLQGYFLHIFNLYNILNKSIRFLKLNMHIFFNYKKGFIEYSISFVSIRIPNKNSFKSLSVKFTQVIFDIQNKTFASKNSKIRNIEFSWIIDFKRSFRRIFTKINSVWYIAWGVYGLGP